MSISLYELFEHFCNAMDGKLRWGDDRKIWTAIILEFFDEYMRSKGCVESYQNYMGIDAVWRDPVLDHIVLALEHENEGKVGSFLAQEIRHLLDLKSVNNIAITYPHVGEERETIDAIRQMVPRTGMLASGVFVESYLIIFGFDTRRETKRAVLWRG